ncbi:neuralized-like protein 4 [Battus philenor]|uniref:neuralized-like protein 4 n=1 Tax=Battus philenor TaxID=42288 RepID=UPI0035D0D9AD
MLRFHRRCGDRVTLLQNNLTAIRNFIEFNHGLILSEEPLRDDIMFEVCIDRKVNVWNGSIEIGVTTLDPEFTELPATATKLRNSAWIMSGSSIVRDGITFMNSYGPELDSLREGDCVGVMRTSRAELMFFVNGRCLGVAAQDMPTRLFAVVDMYGQCVQVSIMQQTTNGMRPIMESSLDQIEEDPNNDDTLTSSDVEGAAAQGDSAYPKDYREDYVPMTSEAACALIAQDRIRFHPRCGILVLLSNNNKSAERARPLDDYNNGVVMTHRPLYDDEIFEIRIDRLVDKWSGSIEVGVTSHNPATIRFPSTMTNMDSGTVMLSGCKVLINGHGTCMEYGNFNLDELRVGDTIGMMRKSSGQLHYYINGIDQGVAADKVDQQVWGVVDLYGMTVKVSIVDPFEEVDTNINDFPPLPSVSVLAGLCINFSGQLAPAIDEDSLLFHTLRASNVIIINDGKTAHRPNAFEYFNNGIVMTNRTLRTNELFQVRLDLVIPKWAGSIEIGVTRHTSNEIQFPFKMSNAKSGTWAMTGEDVIRDGSIIIPQYVRNLNRLVEGDTVGVMRRDMGILHFYVNGVDQGPAAFNIPEQVFGIIDLYGRVAQATIVDNYPVPQMYSPESPVSTESNITSYPEMCFHRVHGRNALLSRTRLTASRATVYSEFNDAVLFSSRPLRECDMFELRIDCMVDCWIGSIEMGVTAIRPEDLEASGGVGALAGTATDLNWDTYILSGCAIMKDGECVRSGYPLDLDTLTVGSRVGMMWHADRSLHYYLDGMDMGKAWYVPHLNIYAVVDLYGQCTQVTILQNEERTFNYNGCTNLENSLIAASRAFAAPAQPYWSFSEYCGENICLTQDYTMARRKTQDPTGALVFSSAHLALDEIFEVKIMERKFGYAGSFRMGVTDINILNAHVNRSLPPSIAYLPHYTAYIDGKYLCYSKPGSRDHDMQSIVPSFEWLRPGDRVGLKKTTDQRVLIYYNCELLDVVFEKVPDKVYVVMEIFGEVVKIQTVTKTVSNALPQTIYNEDFIKRETETIQEITVTKPCEEGEDAVESSEMSCEEAASASVPTVPAPSRRHRDPLPYTFHYVHGSNIKLCSSDTVAVRTKGYKDGLAIVSQPIKRGQTFWFRVDKLEESWGGSASIGAVASLLDELPDRGTFLDPPTWLLTSDMLYDNYEFSFTNSALGLEAIREQTVLSIEFCNDNRLAVTMDGKSLGFAGTVSNDYPHVHPLIDLYGKVCQVSILLHPHVLSSGLSLDLPSIAEHKEETYSELVLPQIVPSEPEPGPSEIRTMGNIRAQSHNSLVEALETVHRQPRPRNPRFATMHHSLILPTSPGRQVHKSYSSHNFGEASGQNEGEARGFDDDPLVPEPYCDTNIQHNDRYPEANDVDNLDIEIMNALTLETGNLPDLTEEQSSSLDESTRRDDLNSDPVSAENLYYLNKLLCLDEGVEAGSLEWEWEAYGETCEHLHVVLKYWNFLVQPYPELRRAVSWGLVKCHCSNCQPDSQTSLSGWVRIERIDGVGAAARAFWPIARTTLSAARAAAGAGIARRPRALAPLPGCTPALYDTWFDEEGKPHHTALALEIDVEGSSADNDRMLAFLIYLKPHVTFVEDSPTSLEE